MVQLVNPSRADARRNRVRIRDAARVEFAAAGASTQMDDVAARAGVGVGTIYRHFPTKEALLGELVRERFLQFGEQARLAFAGEGRAFARLAGLLAANGELMAADAGTQYAFTAAGATIWEHAGDAREELEALCMPVVQEAIADGELRSDFVISDLGLLMCGVCASMGRGAPAGMGDWRRHLMIVVDGLRARPAP